MRRERRRRDVAETFHQISKEVHDNLPSGWAIAYIPELISSDGVLSDGDWVESKDQDLNGDVRLIQLADVGDGIYRDRSKRFLTSAKASALRCTLLRVKDLLVARLPEPLGRACMFPGDSKVAVTVVDVCIVRPGTGSVEPNWLMHQLNSPWIRSRVAGKKAGSGRIRISKKNLCGIPVPIPPLDEQVRIVDRIDELFTDLDAGVAALEQTRRKLKRYRSAVLHAAVTGRLTADWRKAHGSPAESGDQLLARILRERREQWETRTLAKYEADRRTPPKSWRERYPAPVDTKIELLPELPEGWCWASLDQLFQVVRNGTATVPRSSTGVPILRISAVRPMSVDITDVRYLTPAEANAADSWLEVGDLLFTRYNGSARLCGVCGRVERLNGPTVHPDKLIKCKVTEGTVDSAFIELAANAGQTRAAIEGRLRTTAGQVGVSGTDIKASPIPLPALGEQAAIIEIVQEKLSQIDAMEAEVESGLARASRLRQAILKSAFAGKLVPQDPSDEPASVLLARIRAEGEAQAETNAPNRTRKKAAKKSAKKSSPRKKAKKA